MKNRLVALCLLLTLLAKAQEVSLVPKPSMMETMKGTFTITPTTQIILAEAGLEKSASFLNDYLQHFYGFRLGFLPGSRPAFRSGGLFRSAFS